MQTFSAEPPRDIGRPSLLTGKMIWSVNTRRRYVRSLRLELHHLQEHRMHTHPLNRPMLLTSVFPSPCTRDDILLSFSESRGRLISPGTISSSALLAVLCRIVE